jgi:NAD(P)-dependent dehydrogenase (short-subunit alcohol dehydrogenase family)
MDLQLSDKNVVVSGGASGIGAATVECLESEGARVTVLDISPPADGRPYVRCDLADASSIADAAEQLPRPLFGLVNSAGVSGEKPAGTVMRVNFLGLRELTDLLYEELEPGGAVVNVASGAGMLWQTRLSLARELIETPTYDAGVEWVRTHPLSGPDAYDFSKEVAIVYSQYRALRRFATDRVRMNSVSPGAITTPLLPSFYRSMDVELLDFLHDSVGGDGEPADVGWLNAFLLSPRARWVNAADINISGGGDGAVMTGAISHPRLAIPQAS